MDSPKPTGLALITGTLNRGSYGDQVKALQQYLNGLGYDVGKMDSVYGPKVEAAVKQFQLDNGLQNDGSFGPASLGKAKALGATGTAAGAAGSGKLPDDPSFMFRQDTGALNDKFVPKTQEDLDKFYNLSAAAHPVFAGNTPEALSYAGSSGDFSNLLNPEGKPFSQADQEAAMAEANAALKPGFDATKSYDTANTEDVLKAKNADYGNFLDTEKTNFAADKTNLDKNAADNGVLFSGGRVEKEQNLKNTYQKADAIKKAATEADIANTAREYQYRYGGDAAKNPSLSQYYQIGGNTYNPNVARNGVGSTGLSSIYNTGKYNFQGTNVNTNKANTSIRAAALLANKGNKLVGTGYKNQF